ncbi:MAG: hypothetical protein AABX65_01315 [Nanoarchaeota archaeon]
MVKLIGVLLIASSLLSLFAGAFIEIKYGSHTKITGKVIENIIAQPAIPMRFSDYLVGIALSYSIASFMMGIIFLLKM